MIHYYSERHSADQHNISELYKSVRINQQRLQHSQRQLNQATAAVTAAQGTIVHLVNENEQLLALVERMINRVAPDHLGEAVQDLQAFAGPPPEVIDLTTDEELDPLL